MVVVVLLVVMCVVVWRIQNKHSCIRVKKIFGGDSVTHNLNNSLIEQ